MSNNMNYYDTRDRYESLKQRFPGEILVLGSEAEDRDKLRTFDESAEFLRFVANDGSFIRTPRARPVSSSTCLTFWGSISS